MTGQGTSPGLVAAGDVAALATAAADATAKANAAQAASQPLDADLTALAALNATAGLVEQTGAAAYTKRLIGVGAGTSIPTKSDVDTLIAAAAGGGALAPGVVPDLLTVGHPLVGSWWVNTPMLGSLYMVQPTGNGYAFSAFGGGTGGAAADPIGLVFTSVAAANQGCGWYGVTSEVTLGRRPWMRGRVKVSGTAADQGVWIGWVAGGSLSGYGAVSNNTLALSCETVTIPNGGKGQTTWQVTSKVTGSVDYVDTLVPYTAGHDYDVFFSANATDVVWAIYDRTTSTAYSGTITGKAQMPASTTELGVLYTGISGALGPALTLTWGPCTRGNFGPA